MPSCSSPDEPRPEIDKTIKQNYVGGEWRDGTGSTVNENPSDLDNPVGVYAQGSVADVHDAVAAARDAFPGWSFATAAARAEVLFRAGRELSARSEELGLLLASEEGKTLAEGVAEVRRAADIFHYYAGEAYRSTGELLPSARPDVEIEVRREAVGVVGVITPWNFPIAIPAWKIAPALAYGNTVIHKPADLAPGCAWELAAILDRAGVPAGVFNLVMGRGSVVGEAIISHPDVEAVSFTGSDTVGKRIAGAVSERMAKVQLELGGKNAIVVLDDADLDAAVSNAISGAYYSTGQRCTASSRIIVTDGIYDRFVSELAARTREIRVGHALDPDTHVGPAVSTSQLEQNLEYIGIGKDEGATALVEGALLTRRTRGHYLAPTLFVDSSPEMRINREEIFGPVASVIRAADYEEALAITNESRHGLVAALMTTSLKYAQHFRRHAQVGMTMINLPTVGQEFQAPFGGSKASSYGPREQGTYAREFFTEVRTAYVKPW